MSVPFSDCVIWQDMVLQELVHVEIRWMDSDPRGSCWL